MMWKDLNPGDRVKVKWPRNDVLTRDRKSKLRKDGKSIDDFYWKEGKVVSSRHGSATVIFPSGGVLEVTNLRAVEKTT